MQKSKVKINKGFTLIEIMVAVSIFISVMMIVIGALLMLNNANRKAQALRVVVDNLNFALEDMTRNIMTGSEYKCWSGDLTDRSAVSGTEGLCAPNTGVSAMMFRGQREVDPLGRPYYTCFLYILKDLGQSQGIEDKVLLKASKNILIPEDGSDPHCSGAYLSGTKPGRFVSPEVKIKDLKFFLSGKDVVPGQTRQPSVIISLNGEIDIGQYKFATPFNIQTTVSQRVY